MKKNIFLQEKSKISLRIYILQLTKEELKDKLNNNLYRLGLKIQSISKEYHGKKKLGSKLLFGKIRDDNYSFHVGGLREPQFNIGWSDNKFRYGLAFSIQANQSLTNPTVELKPFIDYFNSIPFKDKEKFNFYKYGNSGKGLNESISNKKIDNINDTFWFYGEFIEWNKGNVTDSQYERIKEVLRDIFTIYERIMTGVNKMEKIKEKINLLVNRHQIILQGPPGTGKTRLAKQMVNFMINGDIEPNIEDIKEQVKLIQFHPSYSYEDFVRGIVATTTKDGKGVKYETQNKILATMAKKAKDALGDEYYQKDTPNERKKEILTEADKYILIIDEINRANLSSVLGELIYALEYRDEAVESMYDIDGSREITLPSNLYIIGTMNTADRSIGHIDYAIRRRFAFETILPQKDNINLDEGKKLFEKVENIFSKNLSPEFEKSKVMLGHSYFIADDEEELKNKLEYQVKPLLMEYLSDGVLIDSEEIKEIIKNL